MNRLPQRAKDFLRSAIELARNDLNLETVDSSAVLLAIIKLRDENASAKWLRSVKLTDAAIISFVNQDYSLRHVVPLSVSSPPVFTQSLLQVVSHLDRLSWDSRAADGVYIADILEAVTYSDSPTVRRIFASVNLSMSEVRSLLNPPSIVDRKKLYARRT
jgi:hypothetical protein